MKQVTVKKVLKYSLLPGVAPRLRDLLGSGFGYAAFFMAQIFNAARLLPAGHPYLNPAHTGRFGMRHVIAAAGSNLTFKKQNIDQFIIFGIVLMGLAMLFIQIFLLGIAVFVQGAHAMPTNFVDYFVTDDPTYDIAHVLLERVFGVPGINTTGFFDSCVSQLIPCNPNHPNPTADSTTFPFPFHEALRSLMQLYSVGLLVVAAFIFLYFIIAVAAETAQSGTPFGRRFNHVWAPIRMVVALGLLVPIAQGLNSGQWILLYAAKWGSGFATNGWLMFADIAAPASTGSGDETILGDTEQLVVVPNPPPINSLLEFFSVVAACKLAHETLYEEPGPPRQIDAYLVNGDQLGQPRLPFASTSYQAARAHFGQRDINVRFGEYRQDQNGDVFYRQEEGGVMPFCGEIKLQMTDIDQDGSPGSSYILEEYYALIQGLWEGADSVTVANACDNTTGGGGGGAPSAWRLEKLGGCMAVIYMPETIAPDNVRLPGATELSTMQNNYESRLIEIIAEGTQRQIDASRWQEDLRQFGWAGAGIWYNKVAQLNGAVIGAAYNLPGVVQYPRIMEYVKEKKQQHDTGTTYYETYRPYISDGEVIDFENAKESNIAWMLYGVHKTWEANYQNVRPSGNIFIDGINLVFGTSGLFNMSENADLDIHPLAQLVGIGRGILDSSIRNLGWSAVATGAGGVANALGLHLIGSVGNAASNFLSQVAFIGLSVGFVLYYVLPFMPFIYFFFAVGSWIKTIFEAMVGVPLWALAHIRIDGNGLPGDAALGGYQLILEVFLRPIMIIFGMLASISIFAAMARVLNDIWPLVTSNLSGFDSDVATGAAGGGGIAAGQVGSLTYLRSAVDQFFFTVIYAIIVYMLGTSCFKLIDQIPNHILRWMGAQVSSFGDQVGDPAQNLQRNALMGAQMAGSNIQNAMQSAKGAGASAGAFVKDVAGGGGKG